MITIMMITKMKMMMMMIMEKDNYQGKELEA
jgi:hypothetical protein